MTTMQHQFNYEKLREARINLGWSRTQLAFALNCTYQTVTFYETGRVIPPIKRLLHICEVLEMDVHDFFEEVDDA